MFLRVEAGFVNADAKMVRVGTGIASIAQAHSAKSLQSIARWSVSSQLKNATSCARDGGERWVVRQELMGRKPLESVNFVPGQGAFLGDCHLSLSVYCKPNINLKAVQGCVSSTADIH